MLCANYGSLLILHCTTTKQAYTHFHTILDTLPYTAPPSHGQSAEALAAYPTPEEAAKALAEGHSPWPPFGNPRDLGIPADLNQAIGKKFSYPHDGWSINLQNNLYQIYSYSLRIR